ncbi:MAG: hypothetical protein WBZ05_08395 [Desulfobacterales bacterium]
MKEAMFYESMTENRVRCNLCYHRCKIKERKRGVCGVRKNRLKAFTDKLYKEVCGARLNPVLETIRLMKELDVWVEVTTLIIPGLNDGEQELHGIARFVKSVGPEVPWHVSQFYPAYKLLDRPPTPAATLRRAREIGMEEGLRYVYEGNVPGEGRENTRCYACGALLIERYGLTLTRNRLQDGKCHWCGAKIDGFLPLRHSCS